MDSKQIEEASTIENLLKEIQQDTNTPRNEPAATEKKRADIPKIDVLNLPPRKEIHGNNTKVSFKLSRPLSRLLLVITFLIIILASSYYLWGEDIITLINNL